MVILPLLPEVVTRGVKEGLPWELLYDLVLVAQSEEELRKRVLQWKEYMELKGLKVNIEKTSDKKWQKWWRDSEDWKMAMCSVWERCWGKLYSMQ